MLDERPCPGCGSLLHDFCTFDDDATPPVFKVGQRVGLYHARQTGTLHEVDGDFYSVKLDDGGVVCVGLGPYDIYLKRDQEV